MLNMNLEFLEVPNVTMEDCDHQTHEFEIHYHIGPIYITWLAEEIGGYTIEVLATLDQPLKDGFYKLINKIQTSLSYQSITSVDLDAYYSNGINILDQQYGLKAVGSGMVTYKEEDDQYGLVIDGKYVDMTRFEAALSSFEGFTMTYQFKDRIDQAIGRDMVLKPIKIDSESVWRRFLANVYFVSKEIETLIMYI